MPAEDRILVAPRFVPTAPVNSLVWDGTPSHAGVRMAAFARPHSPCHLRPWNTARPSGGLKHGAVS